MLTPLEVKFILHCYTTPTKYDEPSTVTDATAASFIRRGLIYQPKDKPYYLLTEYGETFIKMILATPFPIFVDPRTCLKKED